VEKVSERVVPSVMYVVAVVDSSFGTIVYSCSACSARFFVITFKALPSPPSVVSLVVEASSVSLVLSMRRLVVS
jgi:hypothetical protein